MITSRVNSFNSATLRVKNNQQLLNMKLVVVLMLAALPLYCYAGSGCQLLEDAVDKTVDPEVSVDEYTEYLAPYIHSDDTKEAVEEFKQCFLSQSNETLANVNVMVHAIYDSVYCAPF